MLNHRDGLRTVDFVLDGIADFAFSLWAALYVVVMGIGNVFKIDDRYINIDR